MEIKKRHLVSSDSYSNKKLFMQNNKKNLENKLTEDGKCGTIG